jgi:hypothetical protein
MTQTNNGNSITAAAVIIESIRITKSVEISNLEEKNK